MEEPGPHVEAIEVWVEPVRVQVQVQLVSIRNVQVLVEESLAHVLGPDEPVVWVLVGLASQVFEPEVQVGVVPEPRVLQVSISLLQLVQVFEAPVVEPDGEPWGIQG